MHAYILFGPPTSAIERKNIQSKGYKIGGYLFTLEVIDLIIRGKLDSLPQRFPKEILKIINTPLVRVCLFNGTDASPYLHTYTLAKFDEQVSQQAQEYLAQHIRCHLESDEIFIPKLFKDRLSEFGETEKDLLRILCPHMPAKHQHWLTTYLNTIEIKFQENTYNKVPYINKS